MSAAVTAAELSALGSPLALKIEGCPLAPYWAWDDVYAALDGWGVTDEETGEQRRPYYIAWERDTAGLWSIGDIHTRANPGACLGLTDAAEPITNTATEV